MNTGKDKGKNQDDGGHKWEIWKHTHLEFPLNVINGHLPPQVLALFDPPPPIEYIRPIEKSKLPQYTGIAQFIGSFEKPDTEAAPSAPTGKELANTKNEAKITNDLKKWDPERSSRGDPYKTLFVSRLNYETSESKIRREFEEYGPIKRVELVWDHSTGKSRGYAFIEYEKERDMKVAYKYGDGKKIDNKRVLVDVERGRTVPGWRPRRLGGGIGSTRAGGDDVNVKHSGREVFTPRSRNQGYSRSQVRGWDGGSNSRYGGRDRDGNVRKLGTGKYGM